MTVSAEMLIAAYGAVVATIVAIPQILQFIHDRRRLEFHANPLLKSLTELRRDIYRIHITNIGGRPLTMPSLVYYRTKDRPWTHDQLHLCKSGNELEPCQTNIKLEPTDTCEVFAIIPKQEVRDLFFYDTLGRKYRLKGRNHRKMIDFLNGAPGPDLEKSLERANAQKTT